jgi:EAL domain-containing protein (putative c-di-GMP-specific phosphodiesterase class I)/GGDEF domain-containing protein
LLLPEAKGETDPSMPIFLIAHRQRDAMVSALAALGRRAEVGKSGRDAAACFAASNARLCIVDLGDEADVGLDALMGAVALKRGAALLLGDPGHPAVDRLIAAGVTHWLPRPFTPADLARALRLTDRYLERVYGRVERRALRDHPDAIEGEAAIRERIAARLADDPAPLSLLLIAFTRFEMINTAFGRETGDIVLDAVAGRIAPLVDAAGATLARMTGTRFVVTCPGDAAASSTLAHTIVERVERPFLADGHMVSLGCRIGIVESRSSDDVLQLLRRAGAALTKARTSEGSPVRLLSVADEGAALHDAELQADLRRALDADEIEIVFQPQLSMSTGVIIGVEALARWQHPEHGELGATTLFAVAERSDYTAALSAHIQKRAASIAAAWPAQLAKLRLAINLTAADIARPGFVASFFEMIDATGFPRERLTVEVTESGLMTDLGSAANVLAELRKGGCRVAIDDFGTGYSSLAYLKALPLDYLKIDKQMAQDIDGTTRDRIVVRGVIDMARSLGLSVVAEGVETEQQLALLAAEGCNDYQGFLFSGPVSVDELERLNAAQLLS